MILIELKFVSLKFEFFQNVTLRKQNICTTLSFISVLITAIGYCGDQSDTEEAEQQNKTSEVVSDIPEVV